MCSVLVAIPGVMLSSQGTAAYEYTVAQGVKCQMIW
jgi:hypothetical protein